MNDWNINQIPDLSDKTILITGANSGIGFYTALELARKGANVILGCRDKHKAEEAKNRIINEVPNAKIEIANFDLSDLNSINEFSDNYIKQNKPLDILINNAGVMTPPDRLTTKDGFEIQWGTNYIGHFALTYKLLPVILKSENSRIITVTSIAHRGAKIFFDDINWEKSYNAMSAYGQSKLANIVFGIELQKRLEKYNYNVKSIIVHPGVVASNLISSSYNIRPTISGWISKTIIKFFAAPTLNGALPSLYAATSKDAQGGKFYGPDSLFGLRGDPAEEKPDKSVTTDPDLAKKLWDISEKMTGYSFLS